MSQNPESANQELLAALPEDVAGVQLVPRYDDDISHPNCLVVAPFRRANLSSRILATVEHYSENPNPSGFPWTILPVTKEPLELKDAVEAAMKFAKANDIPVVFINQDGFSSAAELEQTDTQAIKTGAPRAR